MRINTRTVLTIAGLAALLMATPVAAQPAEDVECNGCVDGKDIKNSAIKGRDVKNGSLKSGDLKNGAITSTKVANRAIQTEHLAKDAVKAGKIEDITRTISVPAGALSFDPDSTIITRTRHGLQWQHDFRNGARFFVRQPADWAGGDVSLRLFFITTTDTDGLVQFFARPDSRRSGDGFSDIANISGAAVAVSGTSFFGNVYEQSFNVPASRLNREWWTSLIQREGASSTYTDDVILTAVALDYEAIQ